ncbi:MAG: energy-coupling factor transporter transmembrane protein EcfT, partial [Synergistaceae bacterium]|nr:energy-coupling factor transporter transmembrane protein EcfT [Synergistaceae bacterium]
MTGTAGAWGASSEPSLFGSFDDRAKVICAFAYVMTLAGAENPAALAAGGVLPMFLVLSGRLKGCKGIGGRLAAVNLTAVFAWIFLPLTYPGEKVFWLFSKEGVVMSMIITWKINLMAIVMLRMIEGTGVSGMTGAMRRIGLPGKLCVMTLLTSRCILLLSENFAASRRALRLRGPGIRG